MKHSMRKMTRRSTRTSVPLSYSRHHLASPAVDKTSSVASITACNETHTYGWLYQGSCKSNRLANNYQVVLKESFTTHLFELLYVVLWYFYFQLSSDGEIFVALLPISFAWPHGTDRLPSTYARTATITHSNMLLLIILRVQLY